MGILNRTLDTTEQRKVFEANYSAVATGVTLNLGIVPFAGTIEEAQIAAWGLSGAPTYAFAINRFITGTGFTTIIFGVGTSNLTAEFGTSGAGAFGASTFGSSGVLMASYGSTLLNVLPNDLLTVTTGAANTASKFLSLGIVLKPIQDVKTHFGML
jgi:hypothetical protein